MTPRDEEAMGTALAALVRWSDRKPERFFRVTYLGGIDSHLRWTVELSAQDGVVNFKTDIPAESLRQAVNEMLRDAEREGEP